MVSELLALKSMALAPISAVADNGAQTVELFNRHSSKKMQWLFQTKDTPTKGLGSAKQDAKSYDAKEAERLMALYKNLKEKGIIK